MRNIVLILLAIAVLGLSACEKKEMKPAQKGPELKGPIIDEQVPHKKAAKKIPFQVVVPPEVKEQWAAAKIVIEDRVDKKAEEFTVKAGDELKLFDSGMTVRTGPFLPDFKMSGQTITSGSSEPNNPAIGIAIYKNGQKIFPKSGEWGWLYEKFPTVHSFEHERYGLLLKEGVKK